MKALLPDRALSFLLCLSLSIAAGLFYFSFPSSNPKKKQKIFVNCGKPLIPFAPDHAIFRAWRASNGAAVGH
jgi:hypothetical protein